MQLCSAPGSACFAGSCVAPIEQASFAYVSLAPTSSAPVAPPSFPVVYALRALSQLIRTDQNGACLQHRHRFAAAGLGVAVAGRARANAAIACSAHDIRCGVCGLGALAGQYAALSKSTLSDRSALTVGGAGFIYAWNYNNGLFTGKVDSDATCVKFMLLDQGAVSLLLALLLRTCEVVM